MMDWHVRRGTFGLQDREGYESHRRDHDMPLFLLRPSHCVSGSKPLSTGGKFAGGFL